jgi:hypothetical protein
MRRAAFRGVIRQRCDEVKLHIGDDAVIQFDVRGGAGPAVRRLGMLGSDIKFPVLIIHRFRVIGDKRRTGEETKR